MVGKGDDARGWQVRDVVIMQSRWEWKLEGICQLGKVRHKVVKDTLLVW